VVRRLPMRVAVRLAPPLALVASVLLGRAAGAQDQADTMIDACHGKESTMDIVDCLGKLAGQWDRRLNAAYQAALKKADPAAVAPLRASERAWLEYRKQRCDYIYANAGGGTITQVLGADCNLRMVKARTDELTSDAAGLAGSGGQ
jgi:uncharacterized protein YecT (DUF1311 family)